MKKVFVLVALIMAVLVGGCATTKPQYHANIKDDVYLDPGYYWINNPFGASAPVRSITMRLINKKYREIEVEVTCRACFSQKKYVWGKRTVSVDSRDDKIFTVMGPEGSGRVTCGITKIK